MLLALCAPFADQVLNVAERLRFGFAEVFTATLVLNQYLGSPKQINVTVIARDAFDRFLKAGYSAARNTEDIEEFVPKGLRFRLFPFGSHPFP